MAADVGRYDIQLCDPSGTDMALVPTAAAGRIIFKSNIYLWIKFPV